MLEEVNLIKGRRNDSVIAIVVITLFFTILTSSAVEVWSDNFEDGNYDGWTPNSYYTYNCWSCANNCLCLNQDDTGAVHHPSTQAVGTWQFDVYSGDGIASVYFISNQHGSLNWTGYTLQLNRIMHAEGDQLSLTLSKKGYIYDLSERLDIWFIGEELGYYRIEQSPGAWQHLRVTRSAVGHFKVYLNDTFVFDATDTEYETSEYFTFVASGHLAIDNIVVDNEVPVETDYTPIIVSGSVLAIVCVVVILAYLRKR
ncbi:MAG: hypothetical protein ACFFF4_10935 [Candidatus Thorarchaeota archaeon]